MKKLLKSLFVFCVIFYSSAILRAQDTFSIVAVDPETGEVGSAGATCLDSVLEGTSAIIISYVKPGKGAIHTQSYWNPINQANASVRMEANDSPEEILTWLQTNDAEGNPEIRQYGIADFDLSGNPRVAAFTGGDCFDWKGHQLGPNYAVQGNILSSGAILDSMSFRFFFEEGDLANKLMAALQGAKKIGADTRCFPAGVSSRSAFIRVAKPTDTAIFYLDLVVGVAPSGVDPIDVLQAKFDVWRSSNPYNPPSGLSNAVEQPFKFTILPNPAGKGAVLQLSSLEIGNATNLLLAFSDMTGRMVSRINYTGQDVLLDPLGLLPGTVLLTAFDGNRLVGRHLFVYQP